MISYGYILPLNTVTPVFSLSSVTGQGVDLLRAFVARVKRSCARYAGIDNDPEVLYERMPTIHFPIDGKSLIIEKIRQ